MINLLYILYIPFCAAIWRLRGGAWNNLLGFSMGTNLTRLLTGILISLPIYSNLTFFMALSASILIGLIIAGWGPFMSMGYHPGPDDSTWINFFPKLFGFVPQSIQWDFAGMVFCGILLFSPCIASFGLIHMIWYWWMIPIVIGASILFSAIYYIFRKIGMANLPNIPGYLGAETEWSEFAVGALLAVVFLLVRFLS